MFTWIDAKRELARRGQSTKYFCKKFFDVYAACNRQAQENQENGVDAFYTDENGVLKNGAYNPVFDSDFYKKNSTAYCEFLCIACGRI